MFLLSLGELDAGGRAADLNHRDQRTVVVQAEVSLHHKVRPQSRGHLQAFQPPRLRAKGGSKHSPAGV